jgi:hypothetical protein
MTGENFGGVSVRSWFASAAGHGTTALVRRCYRRRWDETRGQSRTAMRMDRDKAETQGTKRAVYAGSAVGRWPNPALQRIAARWRFCLSRRASCGPLALRADR